LTQSAYAEHGPKRQIRIKTDEIDCAGLGRSMLRPYGEELRGAEADFAGDGVDFDSAAVATAYAGAEGMLALLFHHDRNVGLDLAGDCFGGQVKTGVCRHA